MTDKREITIRKGREARDLLNPEGVLAEILTTMVYDYWIEFQATKPDEQESREHCYQMMSAIGDLKTYLQRFQDDGTMDEDHNKRDEDERQGN